VVGMSAAAPWLAAFDVRRIDFLTGIGTFRQPAPKKASLVYKSA
jgi:hypothetical protein